MDALTNVAAVIASFGTHVEVARVEIASVGAPRAAGAAIEESANTSERH